MQTKKKRKKVSIGVIIAFIIFSIYSVSLLFPFVWMLINSFRSVDEWRTLVSFQEYMSFPKKIDFSNFATIFQINLNGDNLLSMLFYSVLLTTLGTFISVFFSACAAYTLAKYKFPFRGLIYGLAIFTMVVPIVGTLPSQIQFMEMLHLDDSVVGVLYLYSGAFGFNFILLYSAFESINWTYAEAAQMDGAGNFTIFFKVMVPMCKGPIISCAILQAITLWNDYSTPFLFLNSHKTLAVGLQTIQNQLEATGEYPLIFTAIIISILPVLILYACFQKKIVENTISGGLKG